MDEMNWHEKRNDGEEMDQSRQLMEKYFYVVSLLHRYRQTDKRKSGPAADPHRGQGRVLSLLKLQPQMTQRDMAYLLGMRGQSLGELLGKLERSEYITRTPAEQDRRLLIVQLTDKGKAAAEAMEAQERAVQGPFGMLTEEERAQLMALLDKLIGALEDKLDPADARAYGWDGRAFAGFDFEGMGDMRGGDMRTQGGPYGRAPFGARRPPAPPRYRGQEGPGHVHWGPEDGDERGPRRGRDGGGPGPRWDDDGADDIE